MAFEGGRRQVLRIVILGACAEVGGFPIEHVPAALVLEREVGDPC